MKNKSKQTRRPVAGKSPEKLKRLKEWSERMRGSFESYMTQEELKIMREDAKWEPMK